MALPSYTTEGFEGQGYAPTRGWGPPALVIGVLILIGALGGMIFGGRLGQFMLAGMETLPFAILAFLAYLGVRRVWANVLAYLWLALLLLGLVGLSLLSMLGVLLARANVLTGAPDPARAAGGLAAAIASPQFGAVALWMIPGLLAAGLVFVPAVRRAIARILPIEPRSSVHTIALSVVLGATLMSFGQLIAAGGAPPLLEMVKAAPGNGTSLSDVDQLLSIVYGFAWMLPSAIVAGGFPVVRTFGKTLRRLGLVRPTWRQVGAAIGIALLMVGGATLLDAGIGRVWAYMGWTRTDDAAFEKLLGAAVSPIGAVIIGVTAGLGEETSIRGVLQPRLGILLSNLFFTSLHAYQYSFDGLLSVFIVGSVLGLVRKRSNTTTSSIAHGVYNFTLVIISALGLFQ